MTSTDRLSYPPLDGSLFLPEILEYDAQRNPDHPYFTFPDEGGDGLRSISHLEFYRASQRVAHAINPGRRHDGNQVVAIIANCDTILYQALFLGAMYAGFTPFPMSPRNSPAAVVDMINKVNCRRLLITQHSLGDLASGIRSALEGHDGGSPLHIEEPPTLSAVYPHLGLEDVNSSFLPYPKAERKAEADDLLFYLHSSGSTGFPRPVPVTCRISYHWCIMPSVLEHRTLGADSRVAGGHLPSFHVMGIFTQVYLPIAGLRTSTVYPPTAYHDNTKPPVVANSQNALDNAVLTSSTGIITVPSFLEEWVLSPEAVEQLSGFLYVGFGGGPLAQKTGDELAASGVRVVNLYGSTECGPFSSCIRAPEYWKYWDWARLSSNTQIRWVPLGDGTFECQVLSSERHQPSVENLPDVKGYATSDVFMKHPTIEGLYKVVGRLDDVLVLSSGEKSVPGPMEAIIGTSRYIAGVCMFGRGRSQVGILVEPRAEFVVDVADEKQIAEFRNKIWPQVEEANKDAPNFSRIFKELILVTSPSKPMSRAAKGTVTKKATLHLYEPEINALYDTLEASTMAGVEVPLPTEWTVARVEEWLNVHATAVNSQTTIKSAVDLFEQGFDSLSATFFKNRIIGSLNASPDDHTRKVVPLISPTVVFSHPTLQSLSRHLLDLIAGKTGSTDPKMEIERMVEKYSSGLQGLDVDSMPIRDRSHGQVILMTGSTGALGSYMLASLLKKKEIAKVYVLNRQSKSTTAQQRQHSTFEDRGLDTALLMLDKLVYVEGDTSREHLDLPDDIHDQIRDTVDVIIHNAWRIDFNLSLATFEPNVRGTRHLIDFALASKKASKPRFMFTSSITSSQGWDRKKGLVPEELQLDASVAVGGGYGGGKYASERILAKSGLLATSFRIGQISGGAPRGAWATTEWVPILVKSSVTLGALPNMGGHPAWLPMDAVSEAIIDVSLSENKPPFAVNIVHPRPVAWEALMEPIAEALVEKNITQERIPLLPMSEWFERLEKYAQNVTEEKMNRVPAIKLLDFFRSFAQPNNVDVQPPDFSTEIAEKSSPTMKALEPLSALDAKRWVDYWKAVGWFQM